MPETLRGGQRPSNEQVDKLVTLDYGLPGTGKSSFVLSHPSPIYFFNCDRGIAPLLERVSETAEVVYERAQLDVDGLTPGLAARYLLAFDKLAGDALRRGEGTFAVDGWDLFWDIVKIAKIPGLSDSTLPKEYEPANVYMNNWLQRLCNSPLQVVFTTIAEPIWGGAKKETDQMRSSGFKHRGRWLTHEIYFFTPEEKDIPDRKPLDRSGGQSHSAYIGISKLNERLTGMVVQDLSFASLYRMTFGRAHPKAAELWSPSAGKVAANV